MSLGHWRIPGSKFNIVKKSYLERIVVSFRSTKVFPLSFISSKLRRPPCPFAYVCVMYSVTSVVSDPLWLPWTITRQAPLSMEFSRQKYWSGFPCPLPGESVKPASTGLQADSLPTESPIDVWKENIGFLCKHFPGALFPQVGLGKHTDFVFFYFKASHA